MEISKTASLQEFMAEVVDMYRMARIPAFPYQERIARGIGRSIAELVEDRFAYLLAQNLPTHQFLLNFPCRTNKTEKQFKPDIAVISVEQSDEKIVGLIDLKMDLGFLRTIYSSLFERHNKTMQSVRGQSIETRGRLFSVCSQAIYHVVVVTEENITKQTRQAVIECTEAFPLVKVYFLSSVVHPGDGRYTPETAMREMRIDFSSFESLLAALHPALAIPLQ